MSIAVDQTKLRRIVETLLAGETLDRAEVMTILEIAQLAAGIEADDDPSEHAMLQAIAQRVCSIIGLKTGELQSIPPLPDEEARSAWLGALARQLETRPARELAYAFAFLVSVANLELTPEERTALEEFQHALGLDYRRATDLVVFLTEVVAGDDTAGAGSPYPR